MSLIRTKRQYYNLAAQQQVGNCPKTWSTPEGYLDESLDNYAGIRMVVPGSNKFTPLVERDKLKQKIQQLGIRDGDYIISEVLLPSEIKLAGELTVINGEWVFYYSYKKVQMRQALREEGRHAIGQDLVWSLIESVATPSDVDDLHNLFERYSPRGRYPVIELTVCSKCRGIFPHRNTLVWEVRHY